MIAAFDVEGIVALMTTNGGVYTGYAPPMRSDGSSGA